MTVGGMGFIPERLLMMMMMMVLCRLQICAICYKNREKTGKKNRKKKTKK